MNSPRDDLKLLESAVRGAGEIARKFYGAEFKQWSKAGGSPVTEADLAVDAYLKENLLAARPTYGWLSEESKDNAARLSAARIFVVDPIDGTVAFVKHRPHFTICAAVVEEGRPISALVYNPISEECFVAHQGGGAFLNGAPIHVSDRKKIDGARMLGPKSIFESGWPELDVTSFSSIAYRIALVAAGRHDAMISLSTKRDWDLAAADLIVQEAGGLLSDAAGAPLIYNRATATQGSAIAAGPQLHALLLQHLRQKEGLEFEAHLRPKWKHTAERPMPKPKPKPQLLHLVFGGELTAADGTEFKDLSRLDIVGMYPDFASAKQAWLGKAQSTVDNAQMRYFVAHIHRLFEAEEEPQQDAED